MIMLTRCINVLLTISITLFMLSLYGVLLFKDADMQNKFEGVIDNGQKAFTWQSQSTPVQKEQIQAWIKSDMQSGRFPLRGDEQKINIALMKWVMNQVARVEDSSSTTPYKMLIDARSGHGLLCRHMAAIFAEIISLNDGIARVLQLSSGVGSRYDTHVVVEVWENDRWKLYDPTFNLTFSDGKGKHLNAHEVRALLRAGRKVNFLFHGQVKYPARIDQYHVAYDQLIEYIIAIPPQAKLLAKIPPFRYVLKGAIPILFSDGLLLNQGMDAFSLHNKLYALFFFVLPVISIVFFTLGVVLSVLDRFRRFKSHG